MNESPWYESFFGEDYFEIYGSFFTPEGTAAQVDAIVSMLDLKPGARILDLACGHGRHSIPLSLRGLEVTGYDLSQVFLDRAREDAERQGAKVEWMRGDMRELAFDAEFDAVINIFTAFGYFEDPDDDVKTLEGLRAALRPGGRFLLETMHRDGLPARFQTRGFDRTPNGSIVVRERRWDLARDVIDEDVLLIDRDGNRTEYTTSVRMRSLDEFLALHRVAGLEPESWYGGLDGSALDLTSRRLVLISRRES